jgi:glycosyltransferase involved in cell wall biosynthesis
MNKILLVVTTYNQSTYTKLFFESLKKVDENFDVLVVDDYSSDDTVELCNEYGYEVITKNEPKGLTHSWNLGYQRFKNSKYDYVIIANNDILIPNGAISELVDSFKMWPYSLIVPLSTKNGAGHNWQFQSVDSYYEGLSPTCDDPNNYQLIQDNILNIKEETKKANNLYILDTIRMKMFNGFFFMMNRKVINYESSDGVLFDTNYNMTKNEDIFNWSNLIPNNDFPAICKTSFIFHYKGVSTYEVFDNYGKISNDVSEWKRQRSIHDEQN